MKTGRYAPRAGFTLLEMMIVLAILGILVGLAFPNYLKSRTQARKQLCIENLSQIESAKQIWGVEHGKKDGWLLKLDRDGNVVWEKTYGGTLDDSISKVIALADGGALAGGYSKSPISGTKTSEPFGGEDFWLLRLDSNGEILWQKSYGGTGDDRLLSMDKTSDGGFILAGVSDSPVSGNKAAPNRGGRDVWIVKIDADGNKMWEETFGGDGDDVMAFDDGTGQALLQYFLSIEQTSDGGYIIGSNSNSGISGNKTTEQGWWIIKLANENAPRLNAARQTAAEIAASGFKFTLSGTDGINYVVERSLDLKMWTAIGTKIPVGGAVEVVDSEGVAGGENGRFYRAKLE